MAKTPDSRRPKPRRDKAPPQAAHGASAKSSGNRPPRAENAGKGGKPQQRRPAGRGSAKGSGKASGNALWIYGRHAALAALANPSRVITAVRATEAFVDTREDELAAARRSRSDAEDWSIELSHGQVLQRMLGESAVHQGIAVQTKPLEQPDIAEIRSINDRSVVLALDQATDPRNVGAAIRAAAAFGAHAVITTARSAPPESGALAKAAAGALELLAYVRAPNLARALDTLKENGFWTVGLAGEAETPIAAAPFDRPTAIVIGAEGSGLRRLTLEHCDAAVHIPMSPTVESLNLATAAAIALYEKSRANGALS